MNLSTRIPLLNSVSLENILAPLERFRHALDGEKQALRLSFLGPLRSIRWDGSDSS